MKYGSRMCGENSRCVSVYFFFRAASSFQSSLSVQAQSRKHVRGTNTCTKYVERVRNNGINENTRCAEYRHHVPERTGTGMLIFSVIFIGFRAYDI